MMNGIDLSLIGQEFLFDAQSPMIFTSGLFLFLFLAFVCVYYLLRNSLTPRIIFVTLFSYYFYYKSSGSHVIILALVTISDWLIARHIYNVGPENRKKQKKLITLSLLIDLGMLGYFKYTNFLLDCLATLTFTNPLSFDILLPVGISFFTFQSLSYTIDIYRGQIKPLDSLLDYAFYVSFFPQLVAGPIIRARDFIPQIRKPIVVTEDMFNRGLFLILAGLLKKAVISDYISVNFVERIFDSPQLYSGLENLLGLYGYAIQIYCDFSGYSDLAIGIALWLGFHFPKNFDSPYKSTSISEFWRRWHISLSSWLRDYVYISLGGNRKGKWRTYFNLVLTMLIGGLWHGAHLKFILWGIMHGIALAINRAYRILLGRDKNYRGTRWQNVIGGVLTFHFVLFTWIFFRADSMTIVNQMLTQIFTAFHPELLGGILSGYTLVMLLIFVGFFTHLMPVSYSEKIHTKISQQNIYVKALLVVLTIVLIIQVKSCDIQPFIYFQF